MSRGELAVWAWRDDVCNFGDELGPHLLTRLGYRVTRVRSIADADLFASGSLLEMVAGQARPGAVVWGSGLMYGSPIDVTGLDIRAVRGRLTAEAIGSDAALCDPGSVVPYLYDRPKVRAAIGVVRHFVDKNSYPWADVVIDASRPVDEVIAAIGSCDRIASSSLHGLIVAAAWAIPTIRLHHDGVAGGNFKWSDWFTSGHDVDALLGCLP